MPAVKSQLAEEAEGSGGRDRAGFLTTIKKERRAFSAEPTLSVLMCRFRASLKHKDDGQKKFIKLNSQRQDIIIKYWVSIGSIQREQG